jgi:hypothetical protein
MYDYVTMVVPEIHGLETALVKVRMDVSTDDLRTLFNAEALAKTCKELAVSRNLNAFEASTEVYTVAITGLLRNGRNVVKVLSESEDTKAFAGVFNEAAFPKLATGYFDLGLDRWGNPYRFFLGPWPADWGPIVFRKHRVEEGGVADVLTVDVVKGGVTVDRLGFPATAEKEVYIWTCGPNELSDQAIFDPSGKYVPPASQHYRAGGRIQYMGGGDDLNNWDEGGSWYPVYKENAR